MIRLLIVDDERPVLRTLARTFQGVFEIFLASSIEEARLVLCSTQPEAVLADMQISGSPISGAEFLDEVAQRWPGTIRVLMSGAGQSAHAGLFLPKPWLETEATAIGEAILSRHTARAYALPGL